MYVYCYTDARCTDNGKANCRAWISYAVYLSAEEIKHDVHNFLKSKAPYKYTNNMQIFKDDRVTNNWAEAISILCLIEYLISSELSKEKIIIFSDSKLTINHHYKKSVITRGYLKIVHDKIHEIIKDSHADIQLSWISGSIMKKTIINH